jgi:hypothetical protein
MKITKIYGLYDPRDFKKVYYIGKTVSKYLNNRLCCHLYEARNMTKSNSVKIQWINSLLMQGIKPQIKLITKCYKNSNVVESQIITDYLKRGNPLTNTYDIGGKNKGRIVSVDQKKRIRQTLKEKYASGEIISKSTKPINVYTFDNQLSHTFPSLKETIKQLKVSEDVIRRCCKDHNKRPLCGYYFRYK